MQKFLIFLIRVYKVAISPHIKSQCKFYPTCSDYAEASIKKYGFLHGSLKIILRLLRCNPFSRGGVDFP
ncbi:MAG: membrane protein insertion efficiency factor YidD [Holosporaceae bacterium]|nr:membrane protein insertion efficiency factor YidD [Holosporaceae bacterium]